MSKDKIEELLDEAFRTYRNVIIEECGATLGIAAFESAPACLCPIRERCIGVLIDEIKKIKSKEGS